MTALKKEELERMEERAGLEPDGLTYQQRCSRITAYLKGEDWEPQTKKPKKALDKDPRHHPLYGKKILITPMMVPDAKRNIAYDEQVGHDIIVRETNAGDRIYGAPEEVDRMVGDYEILREDTSKPVYAKTTFPKIGTEISFTPGLHKMPVPVVLGNDGQTGYLWSFPTQLVQMEDTMIQLFGLKTLITQLAPELLPKFSGKPIMSYIDGVTLAASIPLTDAEWEKWRRQKLIDERAGIY